MKTKQTGFTIVELLIVIVIIGILAAITIVAYNGIQNRTYDTAIQSDVTNFAKKIEVFYVDNGKYPTTLSELDSLGVTASSNSYATHVNAVMYCISGQTWAIAGASKSGINGYYYNKNDGGLKRRAWWNAGNPCSDFNVQHIVSGDWAAYKNATQTWAAGGSHIIP